MSPTSDLEQTQSVLEHAERYELLPRHSGMQVLARLWVYPTFTPSMSWTVIVARAGLFVRRLTWDQSRHTTGTYAFFGSEGVLPLATWRPLATELERHSLQPFAAIDGTFRDGTVYGLERISACVTARLTWWETPPPSWEALAQWHAKVIEAFQSILPAHHRQAP